MGTTTVSLDINDICGSILRSIQDRQQAIGQMIWRHQSEIEGFDIEQGTWTPSEYNEVVVDL